MILLCVTTVKGLSNFYVFFFSFQGFGDPKRVLLREKGSKREEKIDMWGL